jgi:hypothetical protein
MVDPCAVCGKPLTGTKEYWAEFEYEFSVAVGPDCFRRVQRAGQQGVMGCDGCRLYPEGTFIEDDADQ